MINSSHPKNKEITLPSIVLIKNSAPEDNQMKVVFVGAGSDCGKTEFLDYARKDKTKLDLTHSKVKIDDIDYILKDTPSQERYASGIKFLAKSASIVLFFGNCSDRIKELYRKDSSHLYSLSYKEESTQLTKIEDPTATISPQKIKSEDALGYLENLLKEIHKTQKEINLPHQEKKANVNPQEKVSDKSLFSKKPESPPATNTSHTLTKGS